MDSSRIATALCLAGVLAAYGEPKSINPDNPQLTPPYRVMYGYSDSDAVHYSGFWLEREQWEKSWAEVFERFNVITGRTSDGDLVKRLRVQGKIFAYHVTNTRDDTHKTVDDFVREWSKPFENTLDGKLPGGFDAISIDELHSSDPDGTEGAAITVGALRELRKRWPHKLIIAWSVAKVGLGGSKGRYGERYAKDVLFDEQLQALVDCCDLYVLECYQREANPHLGLFTETARNINARKLELMRKTVYGLGICQTPGHTYDDRDDIDFGEFLDKQFTLLRTEPVLKQTQGVAFYAFYRAKPELLPTIYKLTEKHYPSAPQVVDEKARR